MNKTTSSFSIISKISTLNDTKLLGVIIIGYTVAERPPFSAARNLAFASRLCKGEWSGEYERHDERKNRGTCRLQ